MTLILLMAACPLMARAADRDNDRFRALAQVETGGNDRAIGKVAHEISRYSIRPDVWTRYSHGVPRSQAVNPVVSLQVGQAVMNQRIASFVNKYGRQPTDKEFALLWHCPARLHHPTADDRDYASRVSNIVQSYLLAKR